MRLQGILSIIIAVLLLLFYIRHKIAELSIITANKRAKRLGFPPVLYLRAFDVDGSKPTNTINLFNVKFEELLAYDFKDIGRLTIVANPEYSIDSVGINVLYPGENGWKSTVIDLMQACRIILLRPSYTDGLLWEFEQIVLNNHLNKTILFLHMGSEYEVEMQEARYKIFLRKISFLKISFPSYDPKKPLIYFDSFQAFCCEGLNKIPVYNKYGAKNPSCP